jgi:hypothetical protein
MNRGGRGGLVPEPKKSNCTAYAEYDAEVSDDDSASKDAV